MKLKFKQTDSQHIEIIAVDEKTKKEHQVGQIFTPSGSGEDCKNAIQICGFTEAFDLWGCGVFGEPKHSTYSYIFDEKGNKILGQTKDIQLQFSPETQRHHILRMKKTKEIPYWNPEQRGRIGIMKTETNEDICHKCYNEPCTCEVKIAHENPYTVKREHDLWIEKVKEKKK